MVTRRTFALAGFGAGLSACGGHNRATGFSGYAFIANQEGGAIAVVDLEVFAVARHIRVDGAPTAVAANPKTARVYALTPENGSVHEIGAGNLTFSRKLQVAAAALEMRLSPAGDALYVLCRKPRQLVRLALNPMRISWALPLPDDPVGFDLSPDGNSAAAHCCFRAHAFATIEGQFEKLIENRSGSLRFKSRLVRTLDLSHDLPFT